MDADRRRRAFAYMKAQFPTEGKPGEIDRAKLMRKTKYTKGRVAQIFDEDQPFGERAAMNLAVSLGLDQDAFLCDQQMLIEPERFESPHDVLEVTQTDWDVFQALSVFPQDLKERIAEKLKEDSREYKDMADETIRGLTVSGRITAPASLPSDSSAPSFKRVRVQPEKKGGKG